MPGIASAATAVVIGHVAAGTSTIRVGAGGVMLPNHAPLVIAEQFGTLEALHPGRIDLGLGRAPGTDQFTAYALRRSLADDDDFPRDVVELRDYFREPEPGQRGAAPCPARACGCRSGFSARASSARSSRPRSACPTPSLPTSRRRADAGDRDLPRSASCPRTSSTQPYVMLGFNVCAAPTDEEARLLRTSALQSFVQLRRGNPGQLPPPVEGFEATLSPVERGCSTRSRPARRSARPTRCGARSSRSSPERAPTS